MLNYVGFVLTLIHFSGLIGCQKQAAPAARLSAASLATGNFYPGRNSETSASDSN
jgi:hypothetical protein